MICWYLTVPVLYIFTARDAFAVEVIASPEAKGNRYMLIGYSGIDKNAFVSNEVSKSLPFH